MKGILCALLGAVMLVGSTSPSSSHSSYFVAAGQLINKDAEGLKASVAVTDATMDNIRRMAREQIDPGVVTASAVQHAVAGINTFGGAGKNAGEEATTSEALRLTRILKNTADRAGSGFNPGPDDAIGTACASALGHPTVPWTARADRMEDVPQLDIEIVHTDHHPAGRDKAGLTAVAPVIANAIFKACGTRVRSLPIAPEKTREALG